MMDLSKPRQRRLGPDLRPLWLSFGTTSAIRPELPSRRAEHSLPYSDVTIYIFDMIFITFDVRVSIYDLSAWGSCWFIVYKRRFIHKFFCVIELFVALFMLSLCPFDISAGVGAFVRSLPFSFSLYIPFTSDAWYAWFHLFEPSLPERSGWKAKIFPSFRGNLGPLFPSKFDRMLLLTYIYKTFCRYIA